MEINILLRKEMGMFLYTTMGMGRNGNTVMGKEARERDRKSHLSN